MIRAVSFDYFRFTLTNKSDVSLELRNQDENAHLYLEDDDVIESSRNPSTQDESIKVPSLRAGTCHDRIAPQEEGRNDYDLEQIAILCSRPSFLRKNVTPAQEPGQESRPPASRPLDAGSRPA